MTKPKKPEHALLLNGNSAEATLDRKMLFRIGIRSAQHVDSISNALKMLSKAEAGQGEPIDIIVCGDNLKDGDAEFFIDKLQTVRSRFATPALILTNSPTRELVMRSLNLGHSSFVSRPYTMDNLAQQTVHAVLNSYGAAITTNKATPRPTLPEPEVDTPETLCERGTKLLKNHYWDSALETFNKAISLEPSHGHAYVGRAKAWKGKGDISQYTDELTIAGNIFMEQHDYENACHALKPLFIGENAKNPLYVTAKDLLQRGDFPHAATAYLYGEELTPAIQLHQQVARACAFTCAPRKAAAVLCKELFEQGHHDKAKQLYNRIVGSPTRRHRPKAQKKTWLEQHMPRLFETVSVAKYSYRAFQAMQERQAA